RRVLFRSQPPGALARRDPQCDQLCRQLLGGRNLLAEPPPPFSGGARIRPPDPLCESDFPDDGLLRPLPHGGPDTLWPAPDSSRVLCRDDAVRGIHAGPSVVGGGYQACTAQAAAPDWSLLRTASRGHVDDLPGVSARGR